MNSILHSVTILFRVQDHLSQKLGEFASRLAGIEGLADDAQKSVQKLANLDKQQGLLAQRTEAFKAQSEMREISRARRLSALKRGAVNEEHKYNNAIIRETERFAKNKDAIVAASASRQAAALRNSPATLALTEFNRDTARAIAVRERKIASLSKLAANATEEGFGPTERRVKEERFLEALVPARRARQQALNTYLNALSRQRAAIEAGVVGPPLSKATLLVQKAEGNLQAKNKLVQNIVRPLRSLRSIRQLQEAESELGAFNEAKVVEQERLVRNAAMESLRIRTSEAAVMAENFNKLDATHERKMGNLQSEHAEVMQNAQAERTAFGKLAGIQKTADAEHLAALKEQETALIEQRAAMTRILPYQQRLELLQERLGKQMMWFGGGVLAAMMGTGVLRGEYGVLKGYGQASIQEQQAKLQLQGLGLSPAAYKDAWQMVGKYGPMGGANYKQAGELYAMLYSTLQEAPSKALFKLAMQTRMVGTGVYGMSDQQFQALSRSAELMAPALGLTKTQRQAAMSDKLRQLMKVYAAMGGSLNMTQLYSGIKTLRFGRSTLSDEGMMAFAMLAQEMGSRAGSGVTQLMKTLIAPTPKAQKGLAALGLLNNNGTAVGYVKGMTNPLDWIENYFIKALHKKLGADLSSTPKVRADVQRYIAQNFASVQAAGIVATLVTQQPKLQQLIGRTKGIPSIETMYAHAMKNLGPDTEKFNADLSTLSATLGDALNPLLKATIDETDKWVVRLQKFAKSPFGGAVVRFTAVLVGAVAGLAALGGALTMIVSGVNALLTLSQLRGAARLLKDAAGGEEEVLTQASGLRGVLVRSLSPALEGVTYNVTRISLAMAALEVGIGILTGAIVGIAALLGIKLFKQALGDTTPPGTRGNANPLKLKAAKGSRIPGPNFFPRFGGVGGSFQVPGVGVLPPAPVHYAPSASGRAAARAAGLQVPSSGPLIGAVHITVNGNVTDPKETAQQTGAEMAKTLARHFQFSGPWTAPALYPNTLGGQP